MDSLRKEIAEIIALQDEEYYTYGEIADKIIALVREKHKAEDVCECCNGIGKIKETEFIDGDESACMTCNGRGFLVKHKAEPSGVVAKKECPHCYGEGETHKIASNPRFEHVHACSFCSGTGIISRELSKDELIEKVKEGLKYERFLSLGEYLSELLELKEGE